MMTEKVTNRGGADGTLFNLNDPCEVASRCKQWRCTEADLRSAMRISGSVVAVTVEAWLKSHGVRADVLSSHCRR
jgi:Protein of unknown function (DUF3606)